MSNDDNIAIVIPYFKADFLESLLASLQGETDARVNVYLFDDCSMTHVDEMVRKYSSTVKRHMRFDNNLGGKSLTAQWDRCLSFIGKEEWVWFIPDDDVLKPGTLAKVIDTAKIACPNVALLHLSTEVIDGSGSDLGFRDKLPSGRYNAAEFYYRVLRGETMVTLGSQVCRRSALNSGFVEFPKAWGSDHATALRCAGNDFIEHIEDATLQFRMSAVNISSQTDDWQQKAEARVHFAAWLVSFLSSVQNSNVTFDQMRDAFLIKGESFFVNTCPLHWRAILNAYKTAEAVGSKFPVGYPIKIILLKALTWMRRH
jgi:glycosyltransferase involved in cell wall biosynthesis